MILGLDIGGANIKAATSDGSAVSLPFPLWKQPNDLAQQLRATVRQFPPVDGLAVAMTGELCDCFRTKREGVNFIIDAVKNTGIFDIRFWSTDGHFYSPENARAQDISIAAANWHALATWLGREFPGGNSFLIDVGSTTTDLIPIIDGKPRPSGKTDFERLQTEELVYAGVKRTPACRYLMDGTCAEFFATMHDAYLSLGYLPESDSCDTADGRPATIPLAQSRLARMLGGDSETIPTEVIASYARHLIQAQFDYLHAACHRVAEGKLFDRVIVSGSGEFLAHQLGWTMKTPQIVRLSERHGEIVSACAPAFALARLAEEHTP